MDVQVNESTLGFQIPTFGEMLTFLVKGFFVVAGIAALVMLLWGALAWVLSGGDKEKVEAARDRMTAAIIGVFMILVALSIVWTLEQIVFKGTMCFGLSCPVSIPTLLNSSKSTSNSSHIFAKPTSTSSTAGGAGGSGGSGGSTGGSTAGSTGSGSRSGTGTGASGTNGANGGSTGSQSGSRVPTPTGLYKLPGTGL